MGPHSLRPGLVPSVAATQVVPSCANSIASSAIAATDIPPDTLRSGAPLPSSGSGIPAAHQDGVSSSKNYGEIGSNPSGRPHSLSAYQCLESSTVVQREYQTMPLMRALTDQYAATRAFDGISVVFSQDMVPSVLPAVASLLAGGASVMATQNSPVVQQSQTLELLRACGVTVELDWSKVSTADYVLDCGGVLAGAKTRPQGVVEVTQRGVERYADLATRVPILSVHASRTKLLEDFYGTSATFLHWIECTRGDAREFFRDKTVVIIGFGCVGQGLAYRLQGLAGRIVILDRDPAVLARAERLQLETRVVTHDRGDNTKALASADVVASATGVPGVVTALFETSSLRGKFLVNMGLEDEFGGDYSSEAVFHFRKIAIASQLSSFPERRYLDALFAAQLEGLRYLVQKYVRPGVYALPATIDEEILARFRLAYGVTLQELEEV